MERFIRKGLTQVLLLALCVVAFASCVRRTSPQEELPSSYLNRQIRSEICGVVNEVEVMLLAEEWAAIDSVELQKLFMVENFGGCRLEEYAGVIEVHIPKFVSGYYDDEHKYYVKPHYDTVCHTLHRDSLRIDEAGAERKYGNTMLHSKGDNNFYVEYKPSSGVLLSMEFSIRPEAQRQTDMFVLKEGARSGVYDGLSLDYSFTDLMLLITNKFYSSYLTNNISVFNGRIEVAAQSSTMSLPDRFVMEYVYTDTYNVIQK